MLKKLKSCMYKQLCVQEACARRRKARIDMLNAPGDETKREEYMKLNHEVKEAVKRQKQTTTYKKKQKKTKWTLKGTIAIISLNMFVKQKGMERSPSVW